MSTFKRMTKNPDSGHWENATWIDDYFGSHRYGVEFMDGTIIDPNEVDLEVDDTQDEEDFEIVEEEED